MEMKPFLTIDQQIDLLKHRGLIIDDECFAVAQLSKLNYYRLSGYMLTLKKNDRFSTDIHFSDIMEIYNFDRELKSLMLLWLEDVEISLRTRIAYTLGQKGSDSYLNKDNFASPVHHDLFRDELTHALNDSKNEAFVKHHNTKYGGILPVWAIVETLSFGAVSRLFSNLNVEIQKDICDTYYHNIRYTYIANWLEGLVVVRNLCAHHSRIFNRGLPSALKFPRMDFEFFCDKGFDKNAIGKKLFFPIVILDRIEPDFTDRFLTSLKEIQARYPFVKISHYGFLQDWQEILSSVNKPYK